MMLSMPGLRRHSGALAGILGALGALLLACALLLAAAAPVVAPYRPNDVDMRQTFLPPAWESAGSALHLLGTDDAGRDIASRIIWGARISVSIGMAASLLGALFGGTLGMCAGFSDGMTDRAVSWLIDVQSVFPLVPLAIFVISVLGGGFGPVVLVLTLATWGEFARVVRGVVRHRRRQDFVLAARSVGVGGPRLLRRYFLPAVLTSVAAVGSFSLAQAILTQAALGFLGVSMDPSAPSWGAMLELGRAYQKAAWWMAMFPGLAIALTAVGAILVGDWLDARLAPGCAKGRP